MGEDRRPYVSYLLRLWQTQSEGALVWHASLESASTGERRGFASLAELCAALAEEMAQIDGDEPCLPTCDEVGA